MQMHSDSFTLWLRTTGKLRVRLLVIALAGKLVIYAVSPPYFVANKMLLISFPFLATLDFIWAIFTSIVIVECVRILLRRATTSFSLKKHFVVVCALFSLLVVFKVLIISSKTSAQYYNYGWSLADKSEYEQAIRSLDIAIQYDSTNFKAYLERAYISRRTGNFVAALKDCNMAIDMTPNSAHAYVCRGNTYYYLGDYKNALVDWNKAISLEPNMSDKLNGWIRR